MKFGVLIDVIVFKFTVLLLHRLLILFADKIGELKPALQFTGLTELEHNDKSDPA